MNKVGKIHIYSIYMIKFINKIKHYVCIYIYIYIYMYLTCPHKREEDIYIYIYIYIFDMSTQEGG
jgi:hypothetical protein